LAQFRLQDLFHLYENYSPPSPSEVLQNTSLSSSSALALKFFQKHHKTMVEAFLEAVRSNEDLQRHLRGVTTAAGLAEVAAQAGLNIEASALVKGFAQLLIASDDALALRNFDNLGWDVGELAWAAKTWELADQA
jgi:DNA-binding phage protein